MAPNLLGNSAVFLANSAEPIQIIGKTGIQQHEISTKTTKVPPKTTPSSAQNATPSSTNTKKYKWEIAWFNVIGFIYLHTFTIYGVYLMFTAAQWRTNLFSKSKKCELKILNNLSLYWEIKSVNRFFKF